MIKPMLAKQFEDYIEKHSLPPVFYAQPKYDGVRAIFHEGRFMSRNGNEILGLPALAFEVRKWFSLFDTFNYPIDGELYSPKLSFEEIVSSVRRTSNLSEEPLIGYYVFDIVDNTPFSLRYSQLECVFKRIKSSRIVLAPTTRLSSIDQVMDYHAASIASGYEGTIIRLDGYPYEHKRTWNLLKLKTTNRLAALVLDAVEGTGRCSGTLGALECTSEGISFFVGSGFSQSMRDELWQNRDCLIGSTIEIKYQEKTSAGVPRFPVFSKILSTISCKGEQK